MPIRHQNLHGQGQSLPAPAIVPLTGLKPMKRSPALEVLRAQDRVVGLSRRIVLSWGLRGDVEWRVPNTDPHLTPSQTHPNATTWYTVARTKIEVTPGCFYRLAGAAIPSGETQQPGVPDWISAGPQGHVRVTILWYDRDGNDTTTTHEVSIPGSTLEFGAEDTTANGLWTSLRNFKIDEVFPPDVPADITEVERWSQHVTADITVEVRGSPRIVDATLSEIPVAIAMDDARDGDRRASHLFAAGSPDGDGPHVDYPYAVDELELGSERLLEVARAQVLRIGPALVQWTAYTETAAGPTTTTIPRTTANDGAGNFENLLASALTSYDGDAEAGWSVSCGGYGRRWAQNSPFVLHDRIAAIPVLVEVLGRLVTAGAGTFRFQTADHSYIDVAFASALGSDAWHTAWGWLEVGVNPDQRVIGQARINHTGASGSLSITAFKVYQCDPDALPVV
jgi:hypothetical protein